MTAARTYDSAGGLDHGRKKISCALSPSEVASLMDALAREFPNPRPALVFKNPFELLCAVALSAQATDASVNLATPALFKAAPDPEAMAALGEDGIAPYIKSIGLWRAKSRNLAALSKILCERLFERLTQTVTQTGIGAGRKQWRQRLKAFSMKAMTFISPVILKKARLKNWKRIFAK